MTTDPFAALTIGLALVAISNLGTTRFLHDVFVREVDVGSFLMLSISVSFFCGGCSAINYYVQIGNGSIAIAITASIGVFFGTMIPAAIIARRYDPRLMTPRHSPDST